MVEPQHCSDVEVPQQLVAHNNAYFCEVFAGGATITAGVMLRGLPVLRPWDIRNGNRFDVLGQDAWVFEYMIEHDIVHSAFFGICCLTNTGGSIRLQWRLPSLPNQAQHIEYVDGYQLVPSNR